MSETDDDAIRLPIDGILDLHTFRPKDVRDLVPDYLDECRRAGITEVRIIHGKGRGVVKRIVRSALERIDYVRSVREGGSDGGGWGATLVELEPRNE